MKNILNRIKAKFGSKLNWFWIFKVKDDIGAEPFATKERFKETEVSDFKEPKTVNEIADGDSSVSLVTFFLPIMRIKTKDHSSHANISDILRMRRYLKFASHRIHDKRVSESVAVFILLAAEEINRKIENPTDTSSKLNAHKPKLLVLMAHKFQGVSRVLHKTWARFQFRRGRLASLPPPHAHLLNNSGEGSQSIFSTKVVENRDKSGKNEITPDFSKERSLFDGSILLDTFSTEGLPSDVNYDTCYRIEIFGGVQEIREEFSDLYELRGPENGLDSVDILSLMSYGQDANLAESAFIQNGVPLLRCISEVTTEEERLGLSIKSLLELPAIEFNSPDFLAASAKAESEFLQPPESGTDPVHNAVQKVADPRIDDWEDTGLIVACLDFGMPYVAPPKKPEILGGSEKNSSEIAADEHGTNHEVRQYSEKLEKSKISQIVTNVDKLEPEVSPDVACELYDAFDDSETLDSKEFILSNSQLDKSQLIYQDISSGGDAQSWLCSPPLRLKTKDDDVDSASYMGLAGHAETVSIQFATRGSIETKFPVSKESFFEVLKSRSLSVDSIESWQCHSVSEVALELTREDAEKESSTPYEPFFENSSDNDYCSESSVLDFKEFSSKPINTNSIATAVSSEGPSIGRNDGAYTSESPRRVHFCKSKNGPDGGQYLDDMTSLQVKYNFYNNGTELKDEGEEASSTKEDGNIFHELDSQRTVDISNDFRKNMSKTTQLWTKTGLLLLEFDENKEEFSGEPQKPVKRIDPVEEHVPETCPTERSDNISGNPGSEFPPPRTVMDLANQLIESRGVNNMDEALGLSGIIFNYRRVFMHLIKNVVFPCNKKITGLIKEILSVRKTSGELYSLGSGITNEISIMSERLEDNDTIDCAYWKTRIKRCVVGLEKMETKFKKVHGQMKYLQKSSPGRITEINDTLTSIRIVRGRILNKYYLFHDPNKLQGRFGSQNVHECTHVDEYRQTTVWHHENNFEELEILLIEDMKVLVSCNEAVGSMIRSIHDGLAYAKRAMCLYESMPRDISTFIAGGGLPDTHNFLLRGYDSDEWDSEDSCEEFKKKDVDETGEEE